MATASSPAASSMQAFAQTKILELIDTAVGALNDAAKSPEADAVHRLRVSIRRLQQALRIFKQYLKPAGVKRVRKQLKKTMTAAGHHRNHDIALKLLKNSAAKFPELHQGRTSAGDDLNSALQSLVSQNPSSKWPDELGLRP
jgi:CHAD domain-containing protein